jgi:probable rRNA maturation factor
MPLRVDIALDHEPFDVDVGRLREAVTRIARDHGRTKGTVSLAIVDDATIHDVNRRFLNHDEATDVVSFVLEEGEKLLDGELVVGADVAARTAAELGVPPGDELLLYVVHGTLHLVGYDDLSPDPRATMRAKEREYLASFGVELPAPADDAGGDASSGGEASSGGKASSGGATQDRGA